MEETHAVMGVLALVKATRKGGSGPLSLKSQNVITWGPCQDGHETQTSDSAQSPATGQQLGFNISTTQCLGRSGQQSVPWVWDMGQVEKDVLRASNGRCGVMAHGAGNKDSQKSGSEFGYTLKALPAFLLTPLQFLIAQISRKNPSISRCLGLMPTMHFLMFLQVSAENDIHMQEPPRLCSQFLAIPICPLLSTVCRSQRCSCPHIMLSGMSLSPVISVRAKNAKEMPFSQGLHMKRLRNTLLRPERGNFNFLWLW